MSLKILWSSNSPTVPTGYGTQSKITYHLKNLGHEIIGHSMYGHHGNMLNIDGITWLPMSKDAYGNDVHQANFSALQVDVIITLIDAWVLNPNVMARTRWIPYMPIDSLPISPRILNSLQAAYRVIVYSKFAQRELKKLGIESYYVPHFIDGDVFKPLPSEDKNALRSRYKLPEDSFVVLINAANKGTPSRKAFYEQFMGFAKFAERRPNSYLVLNTDVWGGYDGEPIDYLLQIAGIEKDKIRVPEYFEWVNGLASQKDVNNLYNIADVTLNATRGGGFELALAESAAAGTLSIGTRHSAMTEVVQNCGGLLVDPSAETFMYQAVFAIPSIDGIASQLDQVYRWKRNGEYHDRSKEARESCLRNYALDVVLETGWKPVLEDIEKNLEIIKKFEKAGNE